MEEKRLTLVFLEGGGVSRVGNTHARKLRSIRVASNPCITALPPEDNSPAVLGGSMVPKYGEVFFRSC